LQTIACIGTGPSLTPGQVQAAQRKGFTLYGCNLAYEFPLAVFHACNRQFYDYYWCRGLEEHPATKYTIDADAARQYGINYLPGRWSQGLCEPPHVSYGHSSGFQLLNLAYHAKPARIVLLGYDMRYAPDYNGRERKVGSTPRHYFGEYPSALQHWPKVSVNAGVHSELVDLYRAVARQGKVEIVNCTPGSAIDCFPAVAIESL